MISTIFPEVNVEEFETIKAYSSFAGSDRAGKIPVGTETFTSKISFAAVGLCSTIFQRLSKTVVTVVEEAPISTVIELVPESASLL